MKNIAKSFPKLIKNILLFTITLMHFSNGNAATLNGVMQSPAGTKVTLRFAITASEHTQGLSGLLPIQFKNSEGMLFVNSGVGPRKFWMPNTFFNLDIIFLDQNLEIVGLEKNVAAHPGMNEPPIIAKTNIYNAQFVLEVKTKCAFSKALKIGDKLKFISSYGLEEIVSKTRLVQ